MSKEAVHEGNLIAHISVVFRHYDKRTNEKYNTTFVQSDELCVQTV